MMASSSSSIPTTPRVAFLREKRDKRDKSSARAWPIDGAGAPGAYTDVAPAQLVLPTSAAGVNAVAARARTRSSA
jgi:hypothetical protein